MTVFIGLCDQIGQFFKRLGSELAQIFGDSFGSASGHNVIITVPVSDPVLLKPRWNEPNPTLRVHRFLMSCTKQCSLRQELGLSFCLSISHHQLLIITDNFLLWFYRISKKHNWGVRAQCDQIATSLAQNLAILQQRKRPNLQSFHAKVGSKFCSIQI